ncbi:MAG: SPASM domain-containing protein [Candidatus Hydrogenedens sp.]
MINFIRKWKKSFYIKGTDERWWADTVKSLMLRKVPDFPLTVQIQTKTGCNGACVFCPYVLSVEHVPKGTMNDELFQKIVHEIAQHKKTRRISPYLMNEPFLDPKILERSRYIKKIIPKSRIIITTNGGKLSPAVVDDLIKDNPFQHIFISMQGIEKEPYEETMRGSLKFEETKRNVEYLIQKRNEHCPELKITITMVKTNLIDVDKAVNYWKKMGVNSKYTALENRGGNNSTFRKLNPGKAIPFKHCTRLFKQAYILFNGDMVLCCTDYFKKMVLGNVAESSIYDVWNSPRAIEIRQNFIRGDFSKNPLCASCLICSDEM